jgi:hypothetical protein
VKVTQDIDSLDDASQGPQSLATRSEGEALAKHCRTLAEPPHYGYSRRCDYDLVPSVRRQAFVRHFLGFLAQGRPVPGRGPTLQGFVIDN